MTSCVNSLPERRARGFTLLEMAIVVFVIGMLTAGLIGPVQTQLEARDRQQTRDYLARAAEALYGFAMTERRLPCPSRDGDGHSELFMVSNSADPSSAGWGCKDVNGNPSTVNGVTWVPGTEVGQSYRGIKVFGDKANA